LLAPRPAPLPLKAQLESAPDTTTQPLRQDDGHGATPKLSARRARATR
jgi:hypothetical protein